MDRRPSGPGYVAWTDGVFGGLAAVLVYSLYETAIAGLYEGRMTFAQLGAFYASVFLGPSAAAQNPLVVLLGYVNLLVLGSLAGLLYAAIGCRIGLLVRAPTSMLCGLLYGLCVWLVLANIVVPVGGMQNTQPFWEALLGSTVFFGFPISEAVTLLAARRPAQAA